MTLAVPPEKLDAFMELMQRREVEATVIGTFTNNGRCIVESHGSVVMNVGLDFLHDGLPKKHLKTTFTRRTYPEPCNPCPERLDETLLAMLQRKNLCSKEFISIQYDHTVQGGHVLGPLQGAGRVQADATLTRVVPGSKKGVGLSQGLFPAYSEIDPFLMAGAGIDTAIRGLIALGVPLDTIAILDNFCWCSSDEPERLGQLKQAARGCYEFATAFGTPFISGKDSMFNDFSGYDAGNNHVKISIPPTLLISSIGIHPDVSKAVSLDAKIRGDLVYIIGETSEELGGSEYFAHLGCVGNTVPGLDATAARARYGKLTDAIAHELIASACPVSHGGLGTALARVAIGGQLGMDLTIPSGMRPDHYLFSESLGRFVVTVDPDNKRAFERISGPDATLLGRLGDRSLRITSRKLLLDTAVDELEAAYKAPFRGY
jgi:phosphoribosylformylglycinamidine synthase